MKDKVEVVVGKHGSVSTLLNGKLHSFKDRPSLVSPDGKEKSWHKNGVYHRDGGKPAFIKVSEYEPSGAKVKTVTREWYVDGSLHRDMDKPAEHVKTKRFNKDGLLISKESIKKWYKKGVSHRDGDKPAMIEKQKKLNLASGDTDYSWDYYFYKFNNEHRDGDKPSYIHNTVTSIDGYNYSYEVVRYCKNDKLHRDGDKPAVTKKEYNEGELILSLECYFVNGRNHRDGDKPAEIRFDPDGEIVKFYKMGKLHRMDKPAFMFKTDNKVFIEFYDRGTVCEERNIFFNQYLLDELKFMSYDFNQVSPGDFPNNYLSSILFSITGKDYINGYPVTNEGEEAKWL